MDRLKRSLKESIRRKQYGPAVYRPGQWANDEAAVKNGICSFHVKYLGCVQVYESRGLHICEDALRLLKSQRRKNVRSVLFIGGDALRVVADETKELLVDQTIEKVSFCAPDRSSDRGFSYICRDGATRRWMCHGFIATRDSGPDQLVTGERLSHAVGIAFGLCLDRKQRRQAESADTELPEPPAGVDTGLAGFRRASITDRLTDPQECKPAELPADGLRRTPSPRGRLMSLQYSPEGRGDTESGRTGGRLSTERPRQMSLAGTSPLFDMAPIAEVPVPCDQPEGNVSLLCRELAHGLHQLSGNTQILPTAPAGSESTPRPDDWLNSLAAGASPAPATGAGLTAGTGGAGVGSQRRGRSPSLASDALLCRTAPTTNPFIGAAAAAKSFEMQM